MTMEERDPIDESLARADRGEVGGTMRDVRREFGAAGNISRPDDRPLAGSTIIERMKSRFMPRSQERAPSQREQIRR